MNRMPRVTGIHVHQLILTERLFMQTTTVSQLKTSLSTYLRRVKAGEEVVITEHGRPIARLSPLAGHLKELEEKGLLKRGEQPLPDNFWDLPRPADPQATVRSAALREREEGW